MIQVKVGYESAKTSSAATCADEVSDRAGTIVESLNESNGVCAISKIAPVVRCGLSLAENECFHVEGLRL